MNRLAGESSLYLRQHANNPVDWYPWGPEAINRAKQEAKPIFLSIGYSACHWCHVMEHESFEDEATARILNEHFVSIKVDREERPDIDAIYMTAVQALNQGQGGWPMSVWLTPDLQPFYAGTYFPPRDLYGRPSFQRLLNALVDAWQNRRDDIAQSAQQITEALRQHGERTIRSGELSDDLLRKASKVLQQIHDPIHGGFGAAPKFPHPMDLRVLLRCYSRFGDAESLAVVRRTLDQMARGGIYDHLGGGFHRYSVDERWLVPHFEKMLYDNALLSTSYLESYQATQDSTDKRVVDETLDYVLREMTAPSGAFYSTQDADSEGVEGKFYVWSKREITDVLGEMLADVFCSVYDVTPSGNWEGHSILHRGKTDEQDARLLKLDVPALQELLNEGRQKLLATRSKRVWPGRDEKILASWNGLMISAFAKAGAVLNRSDYTESAVRAADFLLTHMRQSDGRLFRTSAVGSPAKIDGYLEDYAFLIDALVDLYGTTFDERWLTSAESLAEIMLSRFGDAANGGFFSTAAGQSDLIVRLKDQHDSSTPSGSAVAITGLLRLAELTGNSRWRSEAERGLKSLVGLMEASPMAAGQLLIALDFALGPVQQIAIVGRRGEPDTERVLQAARSSFHPRRIVAFADRDRASASTIPLLADKTSDGPITTFVCENYACRTPIRSAQEAVKQLAAENSQGLEAVT